MFPFLNPSSPTLGAKNSIITAKRKKKFLNRSFQTKTKKKQSNPISNQKEINSNAVQKKIVTRRINTACHLITVLENQNNSKTETHGNDLLLGRHPDSPKSLFPKPHKL